MRLVTLASRPIENIYIELQSSGSSDHVVVRIQRMGGYARIQNTELIWCIRAVSFIAYAPLSVRGLGNSDRDLHWLRDFFYQRNGNAVSDLVMKIKYQGITILSLPDDHESCISQSQTESYPILVQSDPSCIMLLCVRWSWYPGLQTCNSYYDGIGMIYELGMRICRDTARCLAMRTITESRSWERLVHVFFVSGRLFWSWWLQVIHFFR